MYHILNIPAVFSVRYRGTSKCLRVFGKPSPGVLSLPTCTTLYTLSPSTFSSTDLQPNISLTAPQTPNPLVQQIGNYTPADLTGMYRKYKYKLRSCRIAGEKSVSGRSYDRPPRHRFILVSLCLQANAEMVPKTPSCYCMLLM